MNPPVWNEYLNSDEAKNFYKNAKLLGINKNDKKRGKMSKGIKDSKGKIRWSLLPFDAMESVVRILNFGATTKYKPENWKKVPNKAPYVDAIVRHWKKYFVDKEEFDEESKESHLASIICNCLFLIYDREHKSNIRFEEYLKKLMTYEDYVKDLDEHKFD